MERTSNGNRTNPVAVPDPDAPADQSSTEAEMIDGVLLFAVLCGLAAALMGNHTAWPLLASAVFAYGLGQAGAQFNAFYWMMIDFGVIWWIVRAGMTRTDLVIVALFIPAWGFYVGPEGARFWGTTAVVVAQLLLTLPDGIVSRRQRRAEGQDNDQPGSTLPMVMHYGFA